MTDKLDIPTSGIKVFDPDNGWSDSPADTGLQLPAASSGAYQPSQAPQAWQQPPDGRVLDLARAFDDLPLEGVRPPVEQPAPAYVPAPIPMVAPAPAPAAPMLSESPMVMAPAVPFPELDDPMPSLQLPTSRASLAPAVTEAPSRESVEALISSVPSEVEKPELNDQVTALAQVGESLSSFFYALQTTPNGGDSNSRANGLQPQWRDVADLSRQLEQQVEARQAVLENLASIEREIRSTREDLMSLLALLADQERKNLEAASLRAQLSAMAANMLAQRFQSPG